MANISGTWLGTYWQFGNPTRFEMTLLQGQNTLSGNILDNSYLGEAVVKGEITGRKVTFSKCYLANSLHCINYVGIISEDEQIMQGNWYESFFNQGKWEAHRQDDNLTLNLDTITRVNEVLVGKINSWVLSRAC
jgi:hypothetical protein